MYMVFENFSFECRISFELLSFIIIITAVNLIAFDRTVRSLHKKVDMILASNSHTGKIPHDRPNPPTAEGALVAHPPALPNQPDAPGGALLQSILDKLPAHLAMIIASSNDRLAEEFSGAKILETAFNDFYPPGHTSEACEKVVEEILRNLTPCFERSINHMVFHSLDENCRIWHDQLRQQTKKYSEDVQKLKVVTEMWNDFYCRLSVKLGRAVPDTQPPSIFTTPAPGYTDPFNTPGAWAAKN